MWVPVPADQLRRRLNPTAMQERAHVKRMRRPCASSGCAREPVADQYPGVSLMRHRHALYLSEAMTQRLQLVAEAHRLSKSEILERALRRYLTAENNDTIARSDQHSAGGERTVAAAVGARSRHRHRVDGDLRALLRDDHAAVAGGRARGGAGTRPAPVRTGDRERSKPSQDGPRIGCAGDGDGGREPPHEPVRQPATG